MVLETVLNSIEAAKKPPKPRSAKSKVFRNQAKRTKLLAAINRKVNEQLKLGSGLFAVAGRCLYTVEIIPPITGTEAYAEVMVFSTAIAGGRLPNIFCNAELYGQRKYWGEVELEIGSKDWIFKRITNIRQSRSVFSAGFLFGFEVELPDLGITQPLLDELFDRYIKAANQAQE